MANIRDARDVIHVFKTRRVVTESAGLACHAQTMMRVGLNQWIRIGALTAYVSHGRWVADCPCGSGIALVPEWKMAMCFECGGVASVAWPEKDDLETIDAELGKRESRTTQNWFASEPVTNLRLENDAIAALLVDVAVDEEQKG